VKNFISISGVFLMGFLVWYFFIKPFDYIVTFKAKTSPGTLFIGVEEWNLINQKLDSFTYKINDKKAYSFINETINTNGLTLEVVWNFKSINDSVTYVVAGITQKKKSIYNRVTIPFSDTKFEEIVINTIKDFKEDIENQLEKRFKVKYIGMDTIPEITYAYMEFKNINMRNKAEQMMKYNARLFQFINQNNLKDGKFPFLVIDKWDLNKNTINFRFGFPIKLKDSMPIHKDIKYDVIKPKKALKAIYNGNYRTSDRGWFALHEYAKRHKVKVENKPLEIFYDNPFYGGDELKWKAEIYLPIK
jgi:effector-binding domain-containing protein